MPHAGYADGRHAHTPLMPPFFQASFAAAFVLLFVADRMGHTPYRLRHAGCSVLKILPPAATLGCRQLRCAEATNMPHTPHCFTPLLAGRPRRHAITAITPCHYADYAITPTHCAAFDTYAALRRQPHITALRRAAAHNEAIATHLHYYIAAASYYASHCAGHVMTLPMYIRLRALPIAYTLRHATLRCAHVTPHAITFIIDTPLGHGHCRWPRYSWHRRLRCRFLRHYAACRRH